MLLIAFLIVGCLTFLGWYLIGDLFSPFVLVPGVWFAILLLMYVSQPPFYPIIHDFPLAMTLWSLGFLTVAYAVYALVPDERGLLSERPLMVDNVTPSRKVINVYMLITLLVMLLSP